MPTLKAEMLNAAASVGAEPATLNTRELTAGLVANPNVPIPITAGTASHGVLVASASTTAAATTPPRLITSVLNGRRSAVRPLIVIPIRAPTPYNARITGTHTSDRPVGPVSSGAR